MHFWLACCYSCCLFSVRYRCIWGRCGRCGVSWHPCLTKTKKLILCNNNETSHIKFFRIIKLSIKAHFVWSHNEWVLKGLSADRLIIDKQRKLSRQYQLGIVCERRRPWRVETVQKAVEHVEAVVAHLGPDDWMTRGGVRCQQRRRTVI